MSSGYSSANSCGETWRRHRSVPIPISAYIIPILLWLKLLRFCNANSFTGLTIIPLPLISNFPVFMGPKNDRSKQQSNTKLGFRWTFSNPDKNLESLNGYLLIMVLTSPPPRPNFFPIAKGSRGLLALLRSFLDMCLILFQSTPKLTNISVW